MYIATNGRLLKPDFADRLGDAGVAVFNFALDSWDLQPSLPKAFVPAEKNLEQKIDNFWLPQRDMTFVDIRLYGKKVLTIDHHDYIVNRSVTLEGSLSIENTASF